MIIDIVLVTTTLAIAALISFALWRAFRRESGQTRRIVGLALGGAASITLAKLVQLVVLTSAADAGGDAMIARYVDVGSTIVVAIGMALLAASLLDMVMFGRSMWPHVDLSHAAAVRVRNPFSSLNLFLPSCIAARRRSAIPRSATSF